MKKVIRLTESDLMRLVKRIIRESEEWTDEDSNELSSLESDYDSELKKAPYLKNYDGDIDRFAGDFESHDFNQLNSIRDRISAKRKKKEDNRYSKVVKDRPSDYDLDKYRDEYDRLGGEMKSHLKGIPNLKNYDGDIDRFASDFGSSDELKKYQEKSKRKSYLSKNMDRDY
jgi:hypothetical protein